MNAVELTRRIVRIDTINPKSPERPCADLLGKLLGDAGYEVRLHEFAPGRASLVARREGGGKPLAFVGHLDTVPLGAAPWSRDPFAGETQEGRLYGRGSSDMKSGVAAMVAAALDLSRAPLRKAGLTLVLVAGEEDMERRTVARELEGRLHERLLHRRRGAEDARAPHRRERDRGHELRVVVDAVALMGIGPGPVEDIFAVGVILGEDRHRADQAAGAPQEHELRQPAALRGCAAGVDQRREEFMAQERLLAGKRVPFGGIDAGERIGDADAFQVATIQ